MTPEPPTARDASAGSGGAAAIPLDAAATRPALGNVRGEAVSTPAPPRDSQRLSH